MHNRFNQDGRSLGDPRFLEVLDRLGIFRGIPLAELEDGSADYLDGSGGTCNAWPEGRRDFEATVSRIDCGLISG
jgi:hypothetical protein